MQDFTIKVENDRAKYALELFFDNAKDGIVQFINNVLKNEDGVCDAAVLKDKEGTIEIYTTAPDKGKVLGEVDGSLQLMDYTLVAEGNKYVLFDGQRLSLFVKEPEGASDLKIGAFMNLNHAVEDLNSKNVEEAVSMAFERRDAGKKVEEELARKAKLKALAKNETTVETPVTE